MDLFTYDRQVVAIVNKSGFTNILENVPTFGELLQAKWVHSLFSVPFSEWSLDH